MSDEKRNRFFYVVQLGILLSSGEFALWQHNAAAGLFVLTLLSTLYTVFREWNLDSWYRTSLMSDARISGIKFIERMMEDIEDGEQIRKRHGDVTH